MTMNEVFIGERPVRWQLLSHYFRGAGLYRLTVGDQIAEIEVDTDRSFYPPTSNFPIGCFARGPWKHGRGAWEDCFKFWPCRDYTGKMIWWMSEKKAQRRWNGAKQCWEYRARAETYEEWLDRQW
jgi:hypothetical protein